MAGGITHVVDACALIAYFKGEAGHENFAQILGDEQKVLAIHITNLCEVYYTYLRSDGQIKADEAWENATAILRVLDILNSQFMKRVARWKVNYNLPIGDAFAAATTEEHACTLVTADHNDFDAIEVAGVLQINWLR